MGAANNYITGKVNSYIKSAMDMMGLNYSVKEPVKAYGTYERMSLPPLKQMMDSWCVFIGLEVVCHG